MLSLPETRGGWGTVFADPPWRFVNTSPKVDGGYPTLADDAILGLRVGDVAAPAAHLYLWAVDIHLELALACVAAWGFTFKQTLVWVKRGSDGPVQIGLGNWFRHAHELLLFGVRGDTRAFTHDLASVVEAPRRAHSAKPDHFQHYAEKLSPGPRLELFARRKLPGWTAWGNDVTADLFTEAS